jgi:hypothetical protein
MDPSNPIQSNRRILKVLSISYHEFLKVIEPFLQHEPVLSREMSDHLLDVKEIILMSSIWESSSEVCA